MFWFSSGRVGSFGLDLRLLSRSFILLRMFSGSGMWCEFRRPLGMWCLSAERIAFVSMWLAECMSEEEEGVGVEEMIASISEVKLFQFALL